MNNIFFNYLNIFYTVYLNNIIVFFKNPFEYEKYVCKIFKRLKAYELLVNIKKYEFFIKKIKFLNYIITIDSIKIE